MKDKQITFTVYGVNFTSEPTDLSTARCALAVLNSLSVPNAQIVDISAKEIPPSGFVSEQQQ
jgi:hypothetical protein